MPRIYRGDSSGVCKLQRFHSPGRRCLLALTCIACQGFTELDLQGAVNSNIFTAPATTASSPPHMQACLEFAGTVRSGDLDSDLDWDGRRRSSVCAWFAAITQLFLMFCTIQQNIYSSALALEGILLFLNRNQISVNCKFQTYSHKQYFIYFFNIFLRRQRVLQLIFKFLDQAGSAFHTWS